MRGARPDQSGRDLLVSVRRGGRRPLSAQLEDQLREDVACGRLRPGELLPSQRSLAAELGVSRGVVVEAYAQLIAEGVLEAGQGRTTRVSVPLRGIASSPDAGEAGTRSSRPDVRWDVRAESADLAAFPRKLWAQATATALERVSDREFGYGDPAGAPVLREVLAGYLGRARGVLAAPEGVVVTGGMTQALAVVAAVLRGRGVVRVGVEDPGFPIHRGVLRRAGLETVPLPVDADGVRTARLAEVDALLVTPSHQMPTGARLGEDRREQLLDWDGWVLEDDYDGEYAHGAPTPALQGMRPERTVYLGSLSKALAPALRLGWLVAPPDLARESAEERRWSDGGGEVLSQITLAELISRGDLDRHLRRMRRRHRRRRDALLAALAEHLPDLLVTGEHAGLHVHVTLAEGAQIVPVLERAWSRGLALFGYEHGGRAHVVLGYANLPEPSAGPAVRALAEAVSVR